MYESFPTEEREREKKHVELWMLNAFAATNPPAQDVQLLWQTHTALKSLGMSSKHSSASFAHLNLFFSLHFFSIHAEAKKRLSFSTSYLEYDIYWIFFFALPWNSNLNWQYSRCWPNRIVFVVVVVVVVYSSIANLLWAASIIGTNTTTEWKKIKKENIKKRTLPTSFTYVYTRLHCIFGWLDWLYLFICFLFFFSCWCVIDFCRSFFYSSFVRFSSLFFLSYMYFFFF